MFVNVVVSFALATVAVVLVLPLIGYKVDVVVEAVENLIKPNADTAILDATVYGAPIDTGYGAPVDTGYGVPTDTAAGYAAPEAYSLRRSDQQATSRSIQDGIMGLGARVLNR